MKKLSSLSIFFPSLNDAKILPYLITKSAIVAKKVAKKFEIIVINDGSKDDTYEILSQLKRSIPYLKVIHHTKNTGYGGALRRGFKEAKHEFVFYTDGDGQYDIGQLPLLIKKMNNSVDVVNGYKLERSDTLDRLVIGSLYNMMIMLLYRPRIRDIDCDFRLIRKSILKKTTLTSSSGMICLELTLELMKQSARFREIGVSHFPRLFGKSQFYKPSHLFNTLKEHIAFYKENKSRYNNFKFYAKAQPTSL